VLALEVERARRYDHGLTIVFFDLDRFKEINDTLGHHYGDVLLRELGPRLVEAIGPGGFVRPSGR